MIELIPLADALASAAYSSIYAVKENEMKLEKTMTMMDRKVCVPSFVSLGSELTGLSGRDSNHEGRAYSHGQTQWPARVVPFSGGLSKCIGRS